MKFSENWLREWVNPEVSTQNLADQLTNVGLEIDGIENAYTNSFENIVVGEILDIKLIEGSLNKVCKVKIAKDKTITIVSGALGLEINKKVVVALPDAIIANIKVLEKEIDNVMSMGVFCSTKILEDSEGDELFIVPNNLNAGDKLKDLIALTDNIIDISIPPNRGDCLSILGIAKEVSVINNIAYKSPTINNIQPNIEDRIKIEILDKSANPLYVGRIIKDVNYNIPSPLWLVERLSCAGIRSKSPVVDITNYVMLELGQPMHAFDLDKIKGSIRTRKARNGEKIVLLDDREVELKADTLVIADDSGPIAIAGVMGGAKTSVSNTTKNILLESAYFEPVGIRMAAREYIAHTDSSQRFERGVDYNLAPKAIERATKLLIDIVGGKPGPLCSVKVDETVPKASRINLTVTRVQTLLGMCPPKEIVTSIFTSLGFIVDENKTSWEVEAPSSRFDIEIEEDLIEEIARIYGYNNFPSIMPQIVNNFINKDEKTIATYTYKSLLQSRGFHEAITYSFTDKKLVELFLGDIKTLELKNPISSDLAIMRPSLLPSLINTVVHNQRRQIDTLKLFEVGKRFVFEKNKLAQVQTLSGVWYGDCALEQWGVAKRDVDYFDIKADVEAILGLSRKHVVEYQRSELQFLHPGQSANLIIDGHVVGFIGAIHPRIKNELGLRANLVVFELDLDKINKGILPEFEISSKYPYIRRDISLLVDVSISSDTLKAYAYKEAGTLLKNIVIFDVYSGKGIEENKKSVSFGLVFEDNTRTLVDDEVTLLVDKIVKGLEKEFKASLRI